MKIGVLCSISFSVMFLLALLIQGCRKPNDSADNGTGTSSDMSANTQQLANPQPEAAPSNSTALANPTPDTNVMPIAPMTSAPPPAMTTTTPPPPPVAEMQEYTIVKNDKLATLAQNNHVSLSALLNANPGIDPKRLKIGQKIKIPAPTSLSTSAAPMGAQTTADTGGAITYKVKSGDNLTTIARKYHGVTVKAIQQANNLTTTSIKVGQILKIPGTAAPAPAPEAAPVPAPAPAPMTTAPATMH